MRSQIAWRVRHDLSQSQAGDRLGVPLKTLQNWEIAQPQGFAFTANCRDHESEVNCDTTNVPPNPHHQPCRRPSDSSPGAICGWPCKVRSRCGLIAGSATHWIDFVFLQLFLCEFDRQLAGRGSIHEVSV